jgi:hypothetical protein
VKPALAVLVFAGLFAGAVFAGGELLGPWDDGKQSQNWATSSGSTLDLTTTGAQPSDSEGTSSVSGLHERRARRHEALARWRREANALCMRTAREARLLGRKYEQPKGIEDMIALGRVALDGERRFLDELGRLRRPRAERELIGQMLALYEAHHRWFWRTIAALERDDFPAAIRAGTRADQLSVEAEDILAYQLGAAKCGAGAGGPGLALGAAPTG